MSRIGEIVSKHLVTKGGNVILYQLENEFVAPSFLFSLPLLITHAIHRYGEQWRNVAQKTPNWPAIEYMEALDANARESGIDIPNYHNQPNLNTFSWSKDFSNVGGELDMYGVDSYPNCWSCDYSEW